MHAALFFQNLLQARRNLCLQIYGIILPHIHNRNLNIRLGCFIAGLLIFLRLRKPLGLSIFLRLHKPLRLLISPRLCVALATLIRL